LQNSTGNLLLSSLSPACRQSISGSLKSIALPKNTVLYSAEETPKYAHFITSGIASVVTSMASGASAEVGLWGHEGLVQSFQLLGNARIPSICFIQMDATALVMPFKDLQAGFHASPEIRDKILQCVQTQAFIIGQLAACNRLHEAEQRLARWLLMVSDRVEAETYELTQEFLGVMLAARRTTVTVVAGGLQRKGLIRYSRGRIRITDIDGLKSVACECYSIQQKLYANFYPTSA
jgi:CRP-like cAMP-binding protein